jgi:thymidylate synthase (FAD)
VNIAPQYAKICKEDKGRGIEMLRRIERRARISHRTEDKQTEDSYDRFVRAVVIAHGDWSVVEHASISTEWYVDRGIQQEITRHRLFAWTIESTRFVNYEKKMPANFIMPAGLDIGQEEEWRLAMHDAEFHYRRMIHLGCAPQIARDTFPLALGSLIAMTGNLRNWRHFFLMRTTRETHPKLREVSIPLLEEFKAEIPIIFEDIEPLARQVDNLKKGR